MGRQTPDYYVSSLASAGVGDGTLGNPYTILDLSIAGGSYKTPATSDVIGFIDDGTHSLSSASLSIHGGASGGQWSLLRGCKVDGTFDSTGATKPKISYTGVVFYPTVDYWSVADLSFVSAGSGNGIQVDAFSNNGLLYNVDVIKTGIGTGLYGLAIAFGANDITVYGMRVFSDDPGVNWWFAGFEGRARDSIMVLCEARDYTRAGFYTLVDQGGLLLAYCAAHSPATMLSEQSGFLVRLRSFLLHCTTDGNAEHGFDITNISNNSQLLGCISTNNGGYGYKLGISDWPKLYHDNVGYNNTLGNDDSGNWTFGNGATDVDPVFVGGFDLTPTAIGLPSLSHLMGAASGGAIAGALTPAPTVVVLAVEPGFFIGDGSSSETFNKVAEVTAVSGFRISRDLINITRMDDDHNQYMGGERSAGVVDVELLFTLSEYEKFRTLFVTGRATTNFQIQVPDSAWVMDQSAGVLVIFSFAGLVTGVHSVVEMSEAVRVIATVKASGPVTATSE